MSDGLEDSYKRINSFPRYPQEQ
ncbi:hypothetical protein BOH78_5266 [Pichia kudriavzevii]|uniref:Uncharacterized protein n=1 Tax=Pichia kudriavzevii TaxID=4909 RepID=A0A1V2L9C6_PICKU|nr:hypothetical protein BOH78_5471 [Pichia kudriavzevii]ONH70367.1 hypothetical protein BOH78_5266 [Pichia kudriavzevii]